MAFPNGFLRIEPRAYTCHFACLLERISEADLEAMRRELECADAELETDPI
jgi:hypothetical protein